MLKIGILGLGEGRSTISAALQSRKIALKTICDLDIDLCRQRADEFNLETYTTDYQQMLDDPEIDIIGIYTPDSCHAGHIQRALQHDKHVVCTKPLLDDLTEAGDLLELAQATGKQVLVGQSSRFFEPMRRQRQDFEAGLLGKILTVEAYYHADQRWFLKKGWSLEKSFKWLYGGLSHPVDLVRWYLPDIAEVMGVGMLSENGRQAGLKNEDVMHFVFKTQNGNIARVSGAYSGPIQPRIRDSEMSCIIRGTEGCSQADYPDLRYAVTGHGQEHIINFEHLSNYYFRFEGKTHHAGEYQNYLDYFADCIEKDQTASPGLREGIHTVAVMKAMEQSLATGTLMKVDDVLKANGLQDVYD